VGLKFAWFSLISW
jgi:hypothetical protein